MSCYLSLHPRHVDGASMFDNLDGERQVLSFEESFNDNIHFNIDIEMTVVQEL